MFKLKSLAEYQKMWLLAYEAYKGIGGFANGAYLDKYTRESDDKYENRQKVAYYTNLVAPNLNRYVGYIFKNPPTRVVNNKLLTTFIDDCDNASNSLDVFMSNTALEVKIRGVGLVLVDMPETLTSTTLEEQLNNREIPYLKFIPPENVVDFKLDKFGKFEFISFYDTMTDPDDLTQEIQVVRYFDKIGWKVTDLADNVIKQGEHALQKCPIVLISETGDFLDTGEFTQVAQLAKRHYNLNSELDELLRGQTFSILTIQTDIAPDSEAEINIGTDNALFYGQGLDRPDFIAPSADPATTYMNKIKEIEKTIDRIMYNINTNEARESGISLQMKFQGLNSSLSKFASRLEDAERRIFEIACDWLGIPYDYDIVYNKEFDITDITKELSVLEGIRELGYDIPTYEKLKMQKIIANDLGSLDPETAAQIFAEIEDNIKNKVL